MIATVPEVLAWIAAGASAIGAVLVLRDIWLTVGKLRRLWIQAKKLGMRKQDWKPRKDPALFKD